MRGVAMLHSFWYGEGEATFRAVLARGPSGAIANWGIASMLMSNPLAGVGSKPPDAVKAQTAIALGRSIGAKTRREREYFDAVATYYQDFVTRSETAPQASRATADGALAGVSPLPYEQLGGYRINTAKLVGHRENPGQP